MAKLKLDEVLVSEIKVGKRIRNEVGDLEALKTSIMERGLLHPIVVDEKTKLVAGWRRLQAFKALGFEKIPATVVSVVDIKRAEADENVVRKDFTVSEMVAVDRLFRPKLEKEAAERKKEGQKKGGLAHGKKDNEKPTPSTPGPKTGDVIASYVDVSRPTLDKAKRIVEAAEEHPRKFEPILKDVDAGKLSIDTAYGKIKSQEKQDELIKLSKSKPLPNSIKLVNRDFRASRNAKPFENEKFWIDTFGRDSIDMIFTDPEYNQDALEIFSDLARMAAVVLKPGGFLCTYSGQTYLPKVVENLGHHLDYYWEVGVYHKSNQTQVFPRKVRNRWKPIWIYTKGGFIDSNTKIKPNDHDWIFDLLEGEQGDKEAHEWAQGYSEANYLIEKFTKPGDTIMDPMMGSGTTIKAAFDLRRKAIGFEKDKKRFKVAQGVLVKESHAVTKD